MTHLAAFKDSLRKEHFNMLWITGICKCDDGVIYKCALLTSHNNKTQMRCAINYISPRVLFSPFLPLQLALCFFTVWHFMASGRRFQQLLITTDFYYPKSIFYFFLCGRVRVIPCHQMIYINYSLFYIYIITARRVPIQIILFKPPPGSR